ncbi:hypothetical protein FACS1894204_07630 [Synergistales bacterium]|nr:hypothetical protein FACS1894204_07630 [Synergistales bacterium]
MTKMILRVLKWFYRYARKPFRAFMEAYIRLSCADCGKSLRVNGFSRVTKNTNLGNHVNFNGMTIQGNGVVRIGDYFHSGPGCLIIASNHNYEGEAIPYDSTYINTDITIGDFVWLGSRVLILSGGGG